VIDVHVDVNGVYLPIEVNDVNMWIVPTRAHAPPRGRYHHGDLRNALLQAALRLVSRHGVEGFSLRESARAVGVSPAAAYRHFEDKTALLAALAVDGLARMAQAMEAAIDRVPDEPGTPARAVAELAAIGTAYVEFAVANPSQFRVMFGPWCERLVGEDPPPGTFPRDRDPYQILVDTLDALVRSGAVRPEAREGAEIAAWSSVHGLASLLVEGVIVFGPAERRAPMEMGVEERRAALEQVLRAVLAALGASGLAPRSPGPAKLEPRPAGRRSSRTS
jgi:AcrR family transcriptional regulator